MKKIITWTREGLFPTLLVLVLSISVMSVGVASPTSTITQTNSTTMVYLDPPTINGTAIGVNNNITVNIRISNAIDVYGWQAGLIFDPDFLECTGFFEGEFLSDVGPTVWIEETINNTAGVIDAHGSNLLGDYRANGDGRLAYLTFKVKAPGVSDLHLREVMVTDYYLNEVPINIIDVYTVVVDATSHTIVIVSNSTGSTKDYSSGFYGHSFNSTLKEFSFNVTGPHPGFSNVAIPKTLLPWPEFPYTWAIIMDDTWLSKEKITVTENLTHSSIYFTYSPGVHTVQITTRFMLSNISIALSEESISLGESVTISGVVDPVRPDVAVTIEYRPSGGTWSTLVTRTTDSNSTYSYSWTPETSGTYEIRSKWEGDANTQGAISNVKTLTVSEVAVGFDPYILAAVAVAIIIIIAIAIYYVKIRKPEEE